MTDAPAMPSTLKVPLHRKEFFADIRGTVFKGSLAQTQVDGMNALLDEWERHFPEGGDLRQLAYVLATTWWETAKTMEPIREYGRGKGHSYGKADPQTGQAYYGRGFVQLTWKANYAKMGKLVGEDLVNNPDRAMEPGIAAKIAVIGMLLGSFTGKKLGTYFTSKAADWTGARRIINGTDKAQDIADEAKRFYAALTKAKAALPAPPMPPPLTKVQDMTVKLPASGAVAGVAGGLGGVAIALGYPQIAALLGFVTPENLQVLGQAVAIGGALFNVLSGLLPNKKAA